MDKDEVIEMLEQLKAEIEWDLSIEYQKVLDIAIKAVKKVL